MANSVTIGAMRYDLIADTDKFERSMVATRSELRQSEAAFRKTMTPVQKFERELEKLNNLRRKGLITARTYNLAIEKERTAYIQATKAASGYAVAIGKVSNQLTSYAKGFVGFAAATTALNQVGQSLQAIDELAKKSRALGIAGNDLATFRVAAEQVAGLGSQTTDQAIQRFTRRLGQASTGSGEAAEAIKQLGLNAKDLSEAGTVEAFKQVADAIGNVTNQQQQLAIAQKLFDSEGARLVTLLREGSDVWDLYVEKLEKAGVLMSPEQRAKVEEFNDAIADVKLNLTGLSQEAAVLATELKPAVDLMIEYLQTRRRYEGVDTAAGTALGAAARNPFARAQMALMEGAGFGVNARVDAALEEGRARRQAEQEYHEYRMQNEREVQNQRAMAQSEAAIAAGASAVGAAIGQITSGEGPASDTLEEVKNLMSEQLDVLKNALPKERAWRGYY